MQLLNQIKKRVFSSNVAATTSYSDVVDATGLSTLSFGIIFTISSGASVSAQVQCTNDPSQANWADVGTASSLTATTYLPLEILQPGMNFYRLKMVVGSGTSNFVVDALGKGPA